ncbi:hypothetical protein RHGRI_026053 [Rhododendron griersonianum]|uniref:type II protein arginine methyltransferase n=1 Tax=Rhododendron griersonianum TaxID=479676 RepID=A0AAV6IUX6_9ERIC|nr:hypothetical protein RHGRI_026053 [Rhododendron griersonianum]
MASRSLSSRNLSHLFRTSRVSSCTSLSHPPPAFFSTHIVGDTPILVRDFIRSALYDPNHGYFSQRSGSVGVLEKSIKFNQLEGRKAYMQYLDAIYKKNDISWFTPVELFKPWYAHGIAESILRTANLSIPLKVKTKDCSCSFIICIQIYEIGGGSGTCAKGIMDYIMLNAPTRVYSNMTYISVEISSSLAKKQLETVGAVHSHLSKFRVECRDAADQSGWGMYKKYAVMLRTRWLSFSEKLVLMIGSSPLPELHLLFIDVARLSSKLYHDGGHWVPAMSNGLQLRYLARSSGEKRERRGEGEEEEERGDADQQPCWVIMLEVLDNLPHDLIYSENQVSPWMEVWVEKQHERSELSESYKPLQDPLIRRCLEITDLDKDNTTRGGWATSTTRNIMAKVFPKPRRCWLPTGCLKLLEVLHGALPKMSLIASDFSYLPDVKIPGERAPLVSTKKDGSSADYNSYLNAKSIRLLLVLDALCSGFCDGGFLSLGIEGFLIENYEYGIETCPYFKTIVLVFIEGDADIFFPTDFWLLERIDHYSSGWMKLQKDKSSKAGKKRRTITDKFVLLHYLGNEIAVTANRKGKLESFYNALLDTSSFMEEFGQPSRTRTKDGYNPLLDDFKNTKIYLSVPTHNTK